MSKCIGIDLGMNFSSMAYVDECGDVIIIPNDQSENITPSVVMFQEEYDSVIVGQTAAEQSIVNSDRVVQFVKREMGLSAEEVRMDAAGVFHPFQFWNRTLSPEEISAYILKKLKKDAESHFGHSIKHAVIAVPAYFQDVERVATENAGKLAGFNVLAILDEPFATALSHVVLQSKTGKNIFVFNLSGGNLDLAFLSVEACTIKLLHTDGDHRLGGKDWDDALIDHVVELFCEAHPEVDPEEDIGAMQDLRQKVTSMKLQLSRTATSSIAWETGGHRIIAKLSRDDFEKITQNLVSRCRNIVEKAMNDLIKLNKGVSGWEDFDEIIFSGGSTRMPMILKMVEELSGKKLKPSLVNPVTCVAIGAAIRAKQIMMAKYVLPGHVDNFIKSQPESSETVMNFVRNAETIKQFIDSDNTLYEALGLLPSADLSEITTRTNIIVGAGVDFCTSETRIRLKEIQANLITPRKRANYDRLLTAAPKSALRKINQDLLRDA